MSIGGHHSPVMQSDTWLTPPELLDALGPFDLDPCCPVEMPWPTAARSFTPEDDGLAQEWAGRIWLNPPYGRQLTTWLQKMADHNRGTALIFARTETEAFFRHVWEKGSALLFIESRLHFHYPDGSRAKANAGAPSVLVAYGLDDADILAECSIEGAFVPLSCTGQTVVIVRHGPTITWNAVLIELAKRNDGVLDLHVAYALVANHPKAKRNPNWKAKVRQTMDRAGFTRTGRGQYRLEL